MKRKLALWGLAGFVIGLFWVLLSLKVPLSPQSILMGLAHVTLPISLFGRHPIKWY